MASLWSVQRRASTLRISQIPPIFIHSSSTATSPSHKPPPSGDPKSPKPATHFKITSRRSAISLGARVKGTLVSLGIHKRMQTVYHAHSPEVAGKILKVKELVEVENVPAEAVRTKVEQTRERRAARGYVVTGSGLGGASLGF